MAVQNLSAGRASAISPWSRLLSPADDRLRQALFKLPLVLNSFGGFAVIMAAIFLVIAHLTDNEMGKAFWLGAFTTTLLGSILLFSTTKVTELRQQHHIARMQRAHDEMLRQLVEASPVMVSYVDRQRRFRLNNRSYEQWLGVSRNELYGRELREVLGERPYAVVRPYVERALAGEAVRYERMITTLDGGNRYVDTMYTPHVDETGGVIGFFDMVIDITERKRMEEALRDSEERHRTLVENSPVCILELNLGGHLETLNRAGRRMIGEDEHSHIFGLSFLDVVVAHDRERVALEIERASRGESAHAEFGALAGVERRVYSAHFIPLRGRSGEVRKIMGVMQDVTDAHILADELTYQASYDALTGLVNRREFELRLERIIETARIESTENALCYMDLDQFKVINDTCGHIAGDELLRQLGGLLQKGVRKRDTIARLGGDEFGILMEHCSLDQARRVASDLLKKVSDFRFVWEQKSFSVSLSIGIVAIDETSQSINGILSAADSACYAAKDKGRNRIQVFERSHRELAKRHGDMQWVERVESALATNGFELCYQPIEATIPGFEDGVHIELLLRMRTDSGELVPPGAFLPAAERYNLATKIDRWVVGTALAWFDRHPRALAELRTCSINLCGQSLVDSDFLEFVKDAIESSSMPAEKICFEVGETAAIANLTSATRFMSALKRLGCRFALDDFGSGLSSFAYLQTLPVDNLKIDGVFIRNIADNPVDLAIVRSINEIGQVMEKHTVAESVESERIAQKLREIGIDYCQGHFIGSPKPLDELA